MSPNQHQFERAITLIDAANAEDPNEATDSGKMCPKELLYSDRMSDMLERYRPDADDAMKLAIRAQHIERWKSPRNAYPMDRIGYLTWRKDLYKIQANTAIGLLQQAGYGEDVTERVRPGINGTLHGASLSANIPTTARKSGLISSAKPGTRCHRRRTHLHCRER